MLGKKVILYKVTGDGEQVSMCSLTAVDRITFYLLLDGAPVLAAAHVPSLVIPKPLGDLSLTPDVALVKFLFRLEKEEASLVRLLRGVRALRSRVFTMADALGVQIELGEAGAEAEGIGRWAQPPALDLPDFANERDL